MPGQQDPGIAEAATALGITADAVRKRIRRGLLQAYKADGRWYVVLDRTPGPRLDQDPGQNKQESGRDKTQDNGQDKRQELLKLKEENLALHAELDKVQALNRQLVDERDYLRQAHAAALSKIPQLPPHEETRETPERAPRRWWWPFS